MKQSEITMRLVLAAVAAVFLLLPPPAEAQSPTGQARRTIIQDPLGTVITELERQIIGRYYKDARAHDDQGKVKKFKGKGAKRLPPGLAKKGLPPGLAMQLRRNGTLPPGLAKRDLPNDLLSRLPRRGRGQELVAVDDDLVLIEQTTGLILDILENVLR